MNDTTTTDPEPAPAPDFDLFDLTVMLRWNGEVQTSDQGWEHYEWDCILTTKENVAFRGLRRVRMTVEYSAGLAHIEWLRGNSSKPVPIERIKFTGGPGTRFVQRAFLKNGGMELRSRPKAPTIEDIFTSLGNDADVRNYSSFDEWAESLGYDPDSRKAEAVYRACQEQTDEFESLLRSIDIKLDDVCRWANEQ